MAWTFYELRFRLLSPLHIGQQKIGNIQRTRHYVPACTMWGALTARLTRNASARALTIIAESDYVGMGALVKRYIAFTYFFPTSKEQLPVLPSYEDAGLCYLRGRDRFSPEAFAWEHLGSYASTALDYERNAAQEGSLHEVEFIAPHARSDADSRPVDLFGYAIVASGCRLPWPELEAALQDIQIGGERRYGWGRLRLDGSENCGEGESITRTYPIAASAQGSASVIFQDSSSRFARLTKAGWPTLR